jgi:hypothetical protein
MLRKRLIGLYGDIAEDVPVTADITAFPVDGLVAMKNFPAGRTTSISCGETTSISS